MFVDEAQLDVKWADYARLLFDKTFNVFMIFTGPSALNLKLIRMHPEGVVKEQLFPCNFQEYLLLNHDINLTQKQFQGYYIKNG